MNLEVGVEKITSLETFFSPVEVVGRQLFLRREGPSEFFSCFLRPTSSMFPSNPPCPEAPVLDLIQQLGGLGTFIPRAFQRRTIGMELHQLSHQLHGRLPRAGGCWGNHMAVGNGLPPFLAGETSGVWGKPFCTTTKSLVPEMRFLSGMNLERCSQGQGPLHKTRWRSETSQLSETRFQAGMGKQTSWGTVNSKNWMSKDHS